MVLEKLASTSTSPARLLALALAGLAGCYTVAFDEERPDVYYCVDKVDCLAEQACKQFRCVSDIGPRLELKNPEPEALVTSSPMTVGFTPTDFVITESNHKVEGEGKVRITIDSGVIEQTVDTNGALIDISALGAGPHRVEIQAVYGDGTPYPNPSAYDYNAFFIPDVNPDRPQVAIAYPPPGHLHLKDEPLRVKVAVRNFKLVDGGSDCKPPTDCDPFDPNSTECIRECEEATGHAHVYLRDDFPECLNDTPIGCSADYVLSMRTSNTNNSGKEATDEVEAKYFDKTGPMQLTVALQYNDHDPYPAKSFTVYDTIEVHVTE